MTSTFVGGNPSGPASALDIDAFDRFSNLLRRLREIRRSTHVVGRYENENNLEHSCELALAALYLVLVYQHLLPGCDPYDVAVDALFHEFPEWHTGDVVWGDGTTQAQKEAMDAEARQRIRKEFPECPQLAERLERYARLDDDSAWFVYRLDKLKAVRNIFDGSGESWRVDEQSLEFVLETLEAKLKVDQHPMDPVLQQLWNDTVANCRMHPEYFYHPDEEVA